MMLPPDTLVVITEAASSGINYKALLGPVGVIFSLWVGVFFTLRNLQRQRAFEKRLEWIEQTTGNLYRLGDALLLASEEVEKLGTKVTDKSPAFKRLTDELKVLTDLHSKAFLYAKPGTLRRINAAVDAMHEKLTPLVDVSDDELGVKYIGALKEMHRLTLDAAHLLADDARSHLGLERLRQPDFMMRMRGYGQQLKKTLTR